MSIFKTTIEFQIFHFHSFIDALLSSRVWHLKFYQYFYFNVEISLLQGMDNATCVLKYSTLDIADIYVNCFIILKRLFKDRLSRLTRRHKVQQKVYKSIWLFNFWEKNREKQLYKHRIPSYLEKDIMFLSLQYGTTIYAANFVLICHRRQYMHGFNLSSKPPTIWCWTTICAASNGISCRRRQYVLERHYIRRRTTPTF